MAMSHKAVDLLKKVEVFSALDQHHLVALAEIAHSRFHRAGQVVFRQGDPSDTFQVVSSGVFDCYLWDDMLKTERPITLFKPGDIFGEMGLLTDEPRSAFVRAQHDGETFSFDKKPFLRLLENQPKVLLHICRVLAQRLAAANKAHGIKFEQLSSFKITRDLVQLLPLQVILRNRVLPVARKDAQVSIAIVDPTDQVARNTVIQFLNKQAVTWVCVAQADFDLFRDKQLFDLISETVLTVEENDSLTYLTTKTGMQLDAASPAAQKLDEIVLAAISSGASDLHFEPGPQQVNVRGRVDGRLIDLVPAMAFDEYKPIVSRIKVLSDLDITETRLPQDSVLRVRCGQRNVDLRISTVPAPHAEAVACRLFDPLQRKLDFHNLIVAEGVAETIKKQFFLPSGLLLVTGPTGSGKTTTLYAGLQLRQSDCPTNKFVTAEDPIEYELNGMTQVQVNTTIGLTYERILRSLLRQDPDVILVGEIRDKTSMEIAFEAALTGHFVLSSLHTNNVFETVMRIRQRGVEPYIIASALRAVISQRLLPRICSACAQEISPDEKTIAALRHCGILEDGETTRLWAARGCAHCRMSGYKGRMGLYELLLMTPGLRDAVESEASLSELQEAAPAGSYVPMRRYARLLVDNGLVKAHDVLDLLPATAAIAKV